jgi:lipoprotein-anchoring transpeptidase ErfK/SrfK
MRVAAFALAISVACGGYAFAAEQLPQPLTRPDCEKAGMTWNDRANVCGSNAGVRAPVQDSQGESQSRNGESHFQSQEPVRVVITIDKAKQKMTVAIDGVQQYEWPVSTGRAGYSTPSGTYTPTSMNEVWYSQEWDNAPMPHAIFFMKDGHAIHGSYEVKTLGKPVSHGCVRISPKNAATLYALVKKNGRENTQVVLTGITPGGESNVASEGLPGWLESDDNYYPSPQRYYVPPQRYYAPPQRRRGFFEELFGGP